MDSDDFRDAMSRWPSGVTLVASRQDQRVVATTVSSFMSLSLDPPLVLLALGANATILPFLQAGDRFGVSVLAEAQRRLATVYADSYPVGPDPFSSDGAPLVTGALVALECVVNETRTGGDHTIVIAAVERVHTAGDDMPLIRYRRRYHGLSN